MDNQQFREFLERLIGHHINLRDTYLEAQAKGITYVWDTGETIQDRINEEDIAVRNLQTSLDRVPRQ